MDFRLKESADQYLVLRAVLYAEELHYNKDYNDNRVAPTGYAPLPRYFSLRSDIRRQRNKHVLRPEDSTTIRLRAKARQLREEGMSYPAIAKALGISVGTAWNHIQRGD